MPSLSWIGKDAVLNHHLDVPYRVLEKKYDFGDGEPGNKIIHGDNLEALKSLLPEYEGRIKCIYIDPPYNTGNENWVYNDNVNSPKVRKWLGEVVGKESEDLTRHDKWLCMMYPRLKLLQKLLANDGAIFISIDDNEQANLKLICDEIFGAGNFVGQIIWFKKRKGSFLSKKLVSLTEYVLCYTKAQDIALFGGNPDNSESQPIVKRTNTRKTLTIPANIVKTKLKDGIYKAGVYGKGSSSSNLLDDVIVRNNLITNEFQIEAPFTWTQKMFDDELENGTEILINTLNFQIRVIRKNNSSTKALPSFIDGRECRATNEDAYELLRNIFKQERVFDFSKPHELVKRFVDATTHFDKSSIILDSFAGSGTTAHAVLNLNKQDGGSRKFILVEMEDYAETITAERVRRVIGGYGEGKNAVEGTGGSFAYYELGPELLKDGFINEDVSEQTIREYLYYTETNHALPQSNNGHPAHLGNFEGVAYYFLYNKDETTTLDATFLASISEKADRYVIYADNCIMPQKFLFDHDITFKKIPRDIRRF
ncbi:site-specific DNA-methyltransferase [Fibrobacter sp. UWS1]|uniref:site-specific DNA-methyltransferase n=1 Tax=Fibrobacter sp. UWS1 TaxID=1896220 RepID=UPI000BB12DA6|nr:site-specific DNA-methyltransferase [Fibrobacter sp. UWS1]PBC69470.1 adenine-specific DNA-methyltransferase [Fibrobacter sp. UWS1]